MLFVPTDVGLPSSALALALALAAVDVGLMSRLWLLL